VQKYNEKSKNQLIAKKLPDSIFTLRVFTANVGCHEFIIFVDI